MPANAEPLTSPVRRLLRAGRGNRLGRARRGPGLRLRLTLLATALVAAAGALLLWLGWMLVGNVVAAVPALPPGSVVRVHGQDVPADALGQVLRASAQRQVVSVGVVAFVLVVLAAAVLSWTITGRVLRPLQDVTATARQLSAESLDERIGLRGPRDEVAELADTFDAMLDRLEAAFHSQRRFVANASHELRTPLAVVRTELDVTLSDPNADVEELRRMAGVVQDAMTRAEHLVESLLLLARTDGAELAAREPVDLAVLVGRAWQAVAGDAQAKGLRAVFHDASAPLSGDAALLERVAGNLLENAVRHNVEDGWVEVATSACDEWTVLRVAASGPEVAADDAAALFQPFHRGGVARTAREGTGLGLSIVRAAVQAHGGRVQAEPLTGGGLAVRAEFPRGDV